MRLLAQLVDEVQLEHGMQAESTELIVLIATAKAFFRMQEIAGERGWLQLDVPLNGRRVIRFVDIRFHIFWRL